MMTFYEYMKMSAANPPSSGKKPNSTDSEMQLLKAYAVKGFIGQKDIEDIQKMIEQGFSFQDALTVARQQSDERRTIYIHSTPTTTAPPIKMP